MKTRIVKLLRGAATLLLCLLVLAVVLDRLFPLPLPDGSRGSTVVLARDGTPLRAFPDRDGVWRYPVAVEDVSPLYIQALLTYEDRWFWRHPGVNPLALARAFAQWIVHGRLVSGGSTLTMQVARILDGTPHSVGGKLRQILRALEVLIGMQSTLRYSNTPNIVLETALMRAALPETDMDAKNLLLRVERLEKRLGELEFAPGRAEARPASKPIRTETREQKAEAQKSVQELKEAVHGNSAPDEEKTDIETQLIHLLGKDKVEIK